MEINDVVINRFEKEALEKAYGKGTLAIGQQKVWTLPVLKKRMRNEVLLDPSYIVSVKKDGYWIQFEKNSEGKSYMFSPTVSAKPNVLLIDKAKTVPHLMEVLNKLPNGTSVIGEIYLDGETSKKITTILGCLPAKAIARQEKDRKVKFYIHDITRYNEKLLIDETAENRFKKLQEVFDSGVLDSEYIELAIVIKDDIIEAVKTLFANGEEGVVLKKKEDFYHPDKRPAWSTIKIKKATADIDVVAIRFEPPTRLYNGSSIDTWKLWEDEKGVIRNIQSEGSVAVSKAHAAGWIGAIVIGVFIEGKLTEIGKVSSGLTETCLQNIKKNPNLYLNSALTIGAMEVREKELTLRHPFINSRVGDEGFRSEYDIEDCTWDKLMASSTGGDED